MSVKSFRRWVIVKFLSTFLRLNVYNIVFLTWSKEAKVLRFWSFDSSNKSSRGIDDEEDGGSTNIISKQKKFL